VPCGQHTIDIGKAQACIDDGLAGDLGVELKRCPARREWTFGSSNADNGHVMEGIRHAQANELASSRARASPSDNPSRSLLLGLLQ
jgi:hypothetical protein